MNDRVLTLLYALAALLITAFLLIPPPQQQRKISLPHTQDSGINGLKGLYTWLDTNQVPLYSLRKRFSALFNNEQIAADGNVIVLSLPLQREPRQSEWRALATWIKQGNSAIILCAAYYKPAWTGQESCFNTANALLLRLGWKLENSENTQQTTAGDRLQISSLSDTINTLQDSLESLTPVAKELMPPSKLAIFDDVKAVSGKMTPALLRHPWLVSANSEQLGLRLLSLKQADNENHPVMWQLQADSGQVYFTLLPELFSNTGLSKANNAQFFANLLQHSLALERKVIFADYYFGLSELYDPEQFFHDTRLHQTLGFVLVFWLLYVLGYSNRLAPVQPTVDKPSSKDFVVAMAGFFARHVDKATLARQMTWQLLQDIRKHYNISDEAAAWQWLRLQPQLQAAQLELLERAAAKQRTNLEQLSNTITNIRRIIFL